MKTKFSFLLLFFLITRSNYSQVKYEWCKGFGASAISIGVDAAGNIYGMGTFSGTVDLDPSAGVYNLTCFGGNDIFVHKVDALGNFIWAKQLGGTGYDSGRGLTVDSSGNVYLAGGFQGTADMDPGAGTTSFSAIGGAFSNDAFIVKLDSSGALVWARQLGGIDGALAGSITLDVSGNVYTTGQFYNTVDFDPGAGVFNLSTVPGGNDIFISKLDASGSFVWAKSATGITLGNNFGYAIATDTSGNVYTTGYFRETVDFDPGAGTYNLSSPMIQKNFIWKLDSSGSFVWAGTTDTDAGYAIAVDEGGNSYTTGRYTDTADVDPGPAYYYLYPTDSSAYNDVFLIKLNPAGALLWAKSFEGSYDDFGRSLALDSSENIYITGEFQDTLDLDPGVGTSTVISAGQSDIFISKFDPLGNFIFGRAIGGLYEDRGIAIVVDDNNNVYTSGSFNTSVDFDPGPATDILTGPLGVLQGFIIKETDNSYTWPGDANADKVVDNFDLLPLGLFYSAIGPSRSLTGNLWQPYASDPWGTLQPVGSSDIKNIDCNGDGIIDNNDTLAINQNFSLTHAFAPTANEERSTAPDLYFTTASAAYLPGAWIDLDVMAGTSSLPVSNLYGLAFNINYDASLVQPGTESLVYPNSWFASPGINAIKIGKVDAPSSTAYAAETRINHTNADGYGKIATFRFQAKSTISSISTINFSFSQYSANDSSGNVLLFNLQPFAVNVDTSASTVNEIERILEISVYPNPNNGNFNVMFTAQEKSNYKLELRNVLGQIVYKETLPDFIGTYSKPISVSNYGKGVYTITLTNDKHDVVKKVIVY